MNYLELAQDLRRELDISGTGPATVANQTGQHADIVAWIAQAWNDIQLASEGRWRFLRKKFTLTTVASTDLYAYGDAIDVPTAAAITRFGRWRVQDGLNPPRIYRVSSGSGTKTYVRYLGYDRFEAVYGRQDINEGHPIHLTITPNDELLLGPTPNDVFTIEGDYYRSPQVLADDADTPEIKAHFHKVIVYKAMIEYGYQQVAQESLLRADVRFAELMGRLQSDQLESRSMRKAGPLA